MAKKEFVRDLDFCVEYLNKMGLFHKCILAVTFSLGAVVAPIGLL